MPDSPLESFAREGIKSLAPEWRKTADWMENAAEFIGERVLDAESELRGAGEIVVLGLAEDGRAPDFPAARARILKARQYAATAVVSHLAFEVQGVRDRVGELLLQERFPENKYGKFLRQITQATAMAQAAKHSDEARDELLAWAESELPILRELREDLRAAEPAMRNEKEKRDRERRRNFALVLAGILIGLAGVLIGLLF